MPGWYVHMDIARRATAALAGNANASAIFGANGPSAAALEGIAHRNPAYVALGAIGHCRYAALRHVLDDHSSGDRLQPRDDRQGSR